MSFSLLEMWSTMGWLARAVVIVLALMSVGSLAIIVERIIVFARGKRHSTQYVLLLRDFMREKKLREARQAAQKLPHSPVAKVIGAGLDEYERACEAVRGRTEGSENLVAETVLRALDRSKEREVADLRRGLGGLATVGTTAPFVGLFGTVIGIINAFRSMAAAGAGGLGQVSAGISEALVTTAFGLLVAIPAVWMFNYLSGRVESVLVDLNDVSSELVDQILLMRNGS